MSGEWSDDSDQAASEAGGDPVRRLPQIPMAFCDPPSLGVDPEVNTEEVLHLIPRHSGLVFHVEP